MPVELINTSIGGILPQYAPAAKESAERQDEPKSEGRSSRLKFPLNVDMRVYETARNGGKPGMEEGGIPGAQSGEPANALAAAKAQRVECRTCANRTYQDRSNDSGVSFQTPTKISPSSAPAAVMSHEMEHVSREKANAERDDRQVLSQTVLLKFDICPECGRTYVAGGETRTVTRGKAEPQADDAAAEQRVQ